MNKRVPFAVAGFLGFCVSLSAQEVRDFGSGQPGRFTLNPLELSGAVNSRSALGQANLFSALNSVYYGPAPLNFADGRLFSFPGAFAWTEAAPATFLPVATLEQPSSVPSSARLARESGDNKAVSFLPEPDYVGGEVSFFYGRSTGKFSRSVEGGYILGEIVEGNTHISVGASYEHASGHAPVVIPR